MNNKHNDKLVIKFQIWRDIKNPKCKSRGETINNLDLPKRFTIPPMEDKYFHLGMAIKLPEGI